MSVDKLYTQFSRTYDLMRPRPKSPTMSNVDRWKVLTSMLLGFPAAAFSAVGTFSEFVASRGVTDMSLALIGLSAVLGVVAFEFLLLALPFLKAWIDTAWHRFAVSLATFLAWSVSTVANINLILGILGSAESASGYVWSARVAFVLLTGVSGATIAVLMGETASGMVLRSRRENSEALAAYRKETVLWETDKQRAWEESSEYRAAMSINRSNIRTVKNDGGGAPKLDWRTLSDAEIASIQDAETPDEIMQMFNMVPDQRKTALNWFERSRNNQ